MAEAEKIDAITAATPPVNLVQDKTAPDLYRLIYVLVVADMLADDGYVDPRLQGTPGA